MKRITLDHTTQRGRSFVQEWTVVDGDKTYDVVSDSEWGDVGIDKGGEDIVDIAGVPVCTGQIVAISISTGYGPTEDGESVDLDAKWLQNVKENGVDIDDLATPLT